MLRVWDVLVQCGIITYGSCRHIVAFLNEIEAHMDKLKTCTNVPMPWIKITGRLMSYMTSFIRQMAYTDPEISDITRTTEGRSKNNNWSVLRLGLMTASCAHRIYTFVKTLQKNAHTYNTTILSHCYHKVLTQSYFQCRMECET